MLKCLITLFLFGVFQDISRAAFFDNTRRRPSVEAEKKYLAKIGGCAGFFVKNSLNKNYVVTARHCLKYSETDFCDKKGEVFDVQHGINRTCEKVIAASKDFDLVLLSVDGANRDNGDALSLANFIPKKNTRIKLVGFPIDMLAFSGANTNENCWTLSSETFFPFKDTYLWEKGAKDPAIYHNCSTYGGNSGGPVIIEGTSIVVGLPFEYKLDEYVSKAPNEKIISFNLMSNFVNILYKKLSDAGVKIESLSNNEEYDSEYIRSGYYSSTAIKNCKFSVNAIYYTGTTLKKLEVKNEGLSCRGVAIYSCVNGICIDDYGTKIIPLDNGFNYIGQNGRNVYFALDLKVSR